MNRKPTVFVGIVTYNSAKLMAACLDAVLHQTNAPLVITVFDNSSNDEIGKFMRRYPRASFIQNSTNIGFGRGHNEIIRATKLRKQDYYLALNPDVRVDSLYIDRLVESMQTHHAEWGTGKLYKDKQREIFYSVGHAICRDGYAFNIGYGQRDLGQYDTAREIFGASGAAALYSGRLIHTISQHNNFFDSNIFMYYEDVDVDWRARLAGFRCWYEPSATAVHPGGTFPRYLEAEVLCNRFYTTIKNANTFDLLTYNFPIICLHVLFRMLISPRIGLSIVWLLSCKIRFGVRQRATGTSMQEWFRRSTEELSNQPHTFLSRIGVFIKKYVYF